MKTKSNNVHQYYTPDELIKDEHGTFLQCTLGADENGDRYTYSSIISDARVEQYRETACNITFSGVADPDKVINGVVVPETGDVLSCEKTTTVRDLGIDPEARITYEIQTPAPVWEAPS